MQINGFSSSAGAYQTDAKTAKKGGMRFGLMVQNEQAGKTEQTDKTTSAVPMTPKEEMTAFKQEIYKELAEIDKMNSSAILSNSVHITEDGFKRMKEDPAYRKEIMDWLRADARASHGVPIAAHVTTTITGAGATSYGANVFPHDSAAVRASKKALADKKAKVRSTVLTVCMPTARRHSVSRTASM